MIILSQKIFGWYSRWSKDSCKSELKPSEWISSTQTHLISSTVAFWMARSQKILRSMDFRPSDGEAEESHGPAAFHWAFRSVWRESVWNIGLSHPTQPQSWTWNPQKSHMPYPIVNHVGGFHVRCRGCKCWVSMIQLGSDLFCTVGTVSKNTMVASSYWRQNTFRRTAESPRPCSHGGLADEKAGQNRLLLWSPSELG